MSTQSLRRWPVTSVSQPMCPKSTCASSPGGVSARRTVTRGPPNPSSRCAYRRSVLYETAMPSRASSSRIRTRRSGRSALSHSSIRSRTGSSACHASDGAGAGRAWIRRPTSPTSSSVSSIPGRTPHSLAAS